MKLPSLVAGVVLGLAMVSPSVFAQGKDYSDQVLKDKKFVEASLNGANFSESTLDHVDFTKASLKKANFKGAQFKWVTGGNADFSEADFREVTTLLGYFSYSNFSKANFEGVEIQANVYGAIFRGANLKNTKGWGVLGNCDFSSADLRGANFRGMQTGVTDRFRNAIYNEDTSWPDSFDPKAAGCKLVTE